MTVQGAGPSRVPAIPLFPYIRATLFPLIPCNFRSVQPTRQYLGDNRNDEYLGRYRRIEEGTVNLVPHFDRWAIRRAIAAANIESLRKLSVEKGQVHGGYTLQDVYQQWHFRALSREGKS
jgi:hypothetical protein